MGRKKQQLLCENAEMGCKMLISSKDVALHKRMCLYQNATCEGCGENMLLKDLVYHQKIKHCIERNVNRQRIQHAKDMHNKTMTHNQRIHKLRSGVEVSGRHRIKELVHEKVGWSPRVPNAWGEDFERTMSTMSSPKTTSREGILNGTSTGKCYSPDSHSTLNSVQNGFEVKEPETPRGVHFKEQELTEIPTSQSHLQDLYLQQDEISTVAASSCTGYQSVTYLPPSLCITCGKFFCLRPKPDPTACKFHKGPMLKVHGGMCMSCGRLDYQTGCCEGPHTALQM